MDVRIILSVGLFVKIIYNTKVLWDVPRIYKFKNLVLIDEFISWKEHPSLRC